MDKNDLLNLIRCCQAGNQLCQRQLYEAFYRYGMSICRRYARTDAEGEEMLNDAFLRIFVKLDLFDPEQTFPAWFKTICVRSCINYLKKYHAVTFTDDLETAHYVPVFDDVVGDLSAQEILALVRQLPPSYRTVFNLTVNEGYSHVEIAQMLGITEGTSRSNLKIARQKLQIMVSQLNEIRR